MSVAGLSGASATGLLVRGEGFAVAIRLLEGDGEQADGAPVARLYRLRALGRIDGVEALTLADSIAGAFEQGLEIGRLEHQHLVGRGGSLLEASERPQRLGQLEPGVGVARVDVDLAGPERGAGQGIEPLDFGPLLGAGLLRRGRLRRLGALGRRGGLLRPAAGPRRRGRRRTRLSRREDGACGALWDLARNLSPDRIAALVSRNR